MPGSRLRLRARVPGGRFKGLVRDLSRDGLGVEGAEPLRPGHSYTLIVQRTRRHATGEARVCWCRLSGTATSTDGEVVPHYRAGLRWRREEI